MEIRQILALSALVALLFAVDSARASDAVSMADVGAHAAQVWEDRYGGVHEARLVGYRSARDSVASPWQSLTVSAAPGFELARPAAGDPEHVMALGASVLLGRLRQSERERWSSEAAHVEARAAAARSAFVVEATQAFAEWWAAAQVVELHREAQRAYAEDVQTLEPAVRAGAINRLTLADLRADAARMALDGMAWESAADEARAALVAQLGPLEPELGDFRYDGDAPNPWTALIERVVGHPVVRALGAEADARRAEAAAAHVQPTELTFGPSVHVEPSGYTWAGVSAEVSIPLQHRGRAQAAALQGEAAALDAEQQTRMEELQAWLRGRATRFDATRDQLRSLVETWAPVVDQRLADFEAALAVGQVTTEQVIRARRDALDARVLLTDLEARLLASTAIAAEVDRLLRGDDE